MNPLVNGPDSGSHATARKRFAAGKLIALASPEAGVGRSVCAASVAISLAQRWRCLVVDLDTATRNLQTYFGLPAASVGISDFLDNPANSLETIQTRTRVTNLNCIGWSAAGAKPVALGPLRIDSLLRSIHSDPADYVFATLPAGTTDDSLELFTAADIPILVTTSTPALLEKVHEFLRRASTGFSGRSVYLVVNRIQRGGEVREASEFIERAKESLGLNVSILGTIQYDHQLEASFRPGSPLSVQRSQTVTALAFEDIALKIERLLPRGRLDTSTGTPGRKTRRTANSNLRDAVMTSFGGKTKQLQEELWRRDEAIRRLQQQHQGALEELQLLIRNKNDEIAGSNAIIHELEKKIELQTGDLSRQTKHVSDLENSWAALLAERDVLQRERDSMGDRLALLATEHVRVASEATEAIRRVAEILQQLSEEIQLHETARQKEMVVQEMESTLRQEISELQELRRWNETAIVEFEKRVRLEKENHRLKLDLMNASERSIVDPAPNVLKLQRDDIIQDLRLHPPQSLTLIALNEGGKDTSQFAFEMRSILDAGGWKVKFVASTLENNHFYGLQIVTDGSEGALSAARILSATFVKRRLQFTERTAPSPNNFDPLRLIIGRSNW
ncbi:MAG TPA: P-loop NTPase [Terriglobia bacterium]|nr:P-loop NTPase [Terriglobia bacterium]